MNDKFELLKFLKWIHESFGFDELKKALGYRDYNKNSVMYYFVYNSKNLISNCLKLLNYLRFDLNLEETFYKEIILDRNLWNENIFDVIFRRCENFDDFDDFLENNLKISEMEFKEFLVESGTSLFNISQNPEIVQKRAFDFLHKKFGEGILKELILVESLENICEVDDVLSDFEVKLLEFFNFVEREFGFDSLKQLLGSKNANNQTLLFFLWDNAAKLLMKTLNYLLEKFENDKNFLKLYLTAIDDDGNTFLILYYLKDRFDKMTKVSKEFFEFIKFNFGVKFLEEFLLVKNNDGLNFIQILQSNSIEDCLMVLGNLRDTIGNDQEFFEKLIENGKTQKEIMDFFEEKFGV